MSRASNALSAALSAARITQTELAKRSGLQLSQINRYVRGTYDIGPSALGPITSQLPEPHRSRVVSAWLRDHIPAEAQYSVSIHTHENYLAELDEPAVVSLAPDLQLAITYLTDQAREYTEISDLLIDLARALRGPT